ncbi:MAG: DUF3021 domain-containing protein [Peptococcaceae bacterium]|nr:DUF3021 domain-containing protein [Peptococcaceae bacterium]
MKKYVLEFVKRGLMAASGGPLILAIIYGVLEATKTVTVLTPGEACMGIVFITVMAFIAAGITMIYQVESLPLSMAILIHGGVLYLDYLMIYLLNSWLPGNAVGIFTIIFFAGFALVWLVIYLCIRVKTKKLNEKMKARQ